MKEEFQRKDAKMQRRKGESSAGVFDNRRSLDGVARPEALRRAWNFATPFDDSGRAIHFAERGPFACFASLRLCVEKCVLFAFAVVCLLPGIVVAEDFPPELVKFQQHGDKPVFTGAGPGTWDVKIRERGWIHHDPDADGTDPLKQKYRLWYTGYDGTREGIKRLGIAISADGINWTRSSKYPLDERNWIEDMMVVRDGGVFHMFAEGRDDQAQRLTSRDGIQWHREGQLDVRKADGSPIEPGPYGTPTAWLEEGVWHLFYERHDAGVWLATSRDLKVWTNVSDEPVLRPGQGIHDRDLIALNQIVKHKGRYYAYYHGSAKGETPSLWSTCVAVSDNLRSWQKYDNNPILPRELNRSSGIVVRDGERFRLYTMYPEVWLHFSASEVRDQ